MYVLENFAPKIIDIMGTEHFYAFYMSSAVVSSLASYAYKVKYDARKNNVFGQQKFSHAVKI